MEIPTAQEVFNQVVSHLRQQNARSTIDDGRCRYRGANGRMCAVGCLIPSYEYSPGMEGMGIHNLLEVFYADQKRYSKDQQSPTYLLFKERADLLYALQRSHDAYKPEDWEDRFRWVANKYDLTYTQPT